MYEKTLFEIKKAIRTNNSFGVNFYAGTLRNVKLHSDYIDLALESKNPDIVNTISKLTEAKYFNRNVLKKAIMTKDDRVATIIADKCPDDCFDKDILQDSINTKSGDITYAVAKRCPPEFFDSKVLLQAIDSDVPDSVRVVVDRIKNVALLTRNKGAIQKGILRGEDLQNLVGQMLSRSSNKSYDREMQEVVFDIYLDVIVSNLQKNNIPKTFPLKSFAASIRQSRKFSYSPFDIDFKDLKDENRFLIMPVFSYGHAFSAVVKKEKDSDNISITFVNLGARPFETSGNGNQYKEYIYTPEKAKEILLHFSYNIRVDYPEKAVSTSQAYKNFKTSSIAEYNINVTSRDQKVGNCFTKNIEKGLKYALALGLSKTEDKEFQQDGLRVVKKNEEKQKVKFLKPIYKDSEREFSAELETIKLKKQLIDALIKRFPKYEKEINEEWALYQTRKEKPEVRYTFNFPKTKLSTSNYNKDFARIHNSKNSSYGHGR